jgi:hypothetical protein
MTLAVRCNPKVAAAESILEEGKQYTADFIRAIAAMMHPDYIRRTGQESINAAKAIAWREPLRQRIPDSSLDDFCLDLCFNDGDRLSFQYGPQTGYVFHHN